MDALFAKLYEDRLQDKINERNFDMLTTKYQQEQLELNALVGTLSAKLQEEKEDESNKEKWLALIRQYTDPKELTAPLLNALIEKIIVHNAVNTDGGREQEIEIFYRFVGKID